MWIISSEFIKFNLNRSKPIVSHFLCSIILLIVKQISLTFTDGQMQLVNIHSARMINEWANILHHRNGGNSMQRSNICYDCQSISFCNSQAHCWQMFNLLKIISVSMRTAIAYVRLQSQNHRPKRGEQETRIEVHKISLLLQMINCSTVCLCVFSVSVSLSLSRDPSVFRFLCAFFRGEELNTNARRVTNYMQIQWRLLNEKLHELRRCQILMPFSFRRFNALINFC